MEKRVTQAVILAGGPGIRLRPYTYDRPKPMVLVNGRPFLDYLIEMLKKNGITEIVMLLGYLHEKIVEHLGDGSKFGVKVKYSLGDVEDGTGTRIRNGRDLLDNLFLLLYCDNFIHLDLEKLLAFHLEKNAPATVTVYSNKYGVTKNNIFVDGEGFVTKYDRSRKDTNLNGVDLGFFILKRDEILPLLPAEDNFFFEDVVLPELISKRRLAGFVIDQPYYSIGNLERLKQTEKFLGPQKVIFLDRDGVINKKMPPQDYVKKWEEFKFLKGAVEGLKFLKERGYDIYIVSNQSGIGRGLMTQKDLFDIHKNMEKELEKEGLKIDGIYYCHHSWDAGCDCRKPRPGMLLEAAIDHQIDLPRAILIGDDERDIEAGKAAGCKAILMKTDSSLFDLVKNLAEQLII